MTSSATPCSSLAMDPRCHATHPRCRATEPRCRATDCAIETLRRTQDRYTVASMRELDPSAMLR
jgi:hypothetical protein